MSSFSGIKSIQRGTITISGSSATGTATITAVDTSKTELRYLGHSDTSSTAPAGRDVWCRIDLTNTTTVTATRANTGASQIIVSFEVTEYY